MNFRTTTLRGILVVFVGICLIKLFFIQVIDREYSMQANKNVIRRIKEYPTRGNIYDRKGRLMVFNVPIYDLFIVTREAKNFDSLKFCNLFKIQQPELRQLFVNLRARKEYSQYKETLFIEKLSVEALASVQDRLDEFPGIYVQPRTVRAYGDSTAAAVLGYVSEITAPQLKKDASRFYRQRDNIGQSGLESFYEASLRGTPGVRFEMQDVNGASKGKFKDGAFDTLSVAGLDLHVGLDADLQAYGEKLMSGKIGSVVCIEPSTGEILAFVSAPSYDPNLLTGKAFSEHFAKLTENPLTPLFSRPLMAQYRPGSIFKIAQSLVGLQQRVITPHTRIRCDRAVIGCHGPHTESDLTGAIANSCNPYFYNVFRRMILKGDHGNAFEESRAGLATWNEMIRSLGFGDTLGVDLPNEKGGLIPTPKYYDRAYRNRQWKFSNIYSLAIGEGENLVVPLQMANFAAIIANKGFYYRPHFARRIGLTNGPAAQYAEKRYTGIDSAHFNVAINAMEEVVKRGTGQYRAKLKDIVVCGKTGTVENKPPKEPHSVFIAFAPRDKPKIAVSVYVENAGEGARAAASIASLMIEKYLIGNTERPEIEEYVLQGKFF